MLSRPCAVGAAITLILLLSTGAAPAGPIEGEWSVGEIRFEGNRSISRRELLAVMQLQPSGLFRRTTYSFTLLAIDLEEIRGLYRSRGFLDVRVDSPDIETQARRNRVDITIEIDEGPRRHIGSILFTGNRILSDSDLRGIIDLRRGQPLDSALIARAVRQIRDALYARGHLLAEVESDREPDLSGRTADVVMYIHEGPAVLAGDLDIIGLDGVRPRAVEREMEFSDSMLLTPLPVGRSIRNLYATGLFNLVRIEPQDTLDPGEDPDSAVLPVLVQVHETDPLALQAGGGYDFEEGLFLDFGLAYRNLLGLGHRASLGGRISAEVLNVRLGYRYPWLGGIPLTADWSGYAERRREETFEALLGGTRVDLTGRLGYVSAYRFWNRFERVQFTRAPVPTGDFPTAARNTTLLFGAGLSTDGREDVFPPPLATAAYLEAEMAGPDAWGSNQFYRFRGAIQLFYPRVLPFLRLSSSVFSGYVDGFGVQAGLVPPNELFRPGREEVPPVRGYLESEVSPVDELGTARGGRFALFLTPLDLTFPIVAIFRGALFLDGGFVWPDLNSVRLGDLRWGAGPGIRVILPMGTLRIDYGIRLQRPFDPAGRWLLSVTVP